MSLSLLASAAHALADAPEPRLLGWNAEEWVWAGITIFFLLAIFVGKGHRTLTGVLDAHIAQTRRSLDEAAAIRVEAEALLAEAKRQQAATAADAAAMLAHAQIEALAIIAKAESDTGAVIAGRARMATDRIEAAERAAVTGLRDKAAGAATQAAGELIAASHHAGADRALVDAAIGAI